MNELQLVTNILKELPDSVVWVIGFYFGLKLVFYGSIYGVIALAIKSLHNWAITKKVKPEKEIVISHDIYKMSIDQNAYDFLMQQLKRLNDHSRFIHESDVRRMSEALDLYIKEQKK